MNNTTSARLIVGINKNSRLRFLRFVFFGAFCGYYTAKVSEGTNIGTCPATNTTVQLLALYADPESHNAQRYKQTDGRVDGQTDDMMMPILSTTIRSTKTYFSEHRMRSAIKRHYPNQLRYYNSQTFIRSGDFF